MKVDGALPVDDPADAGRWRPFVPDPDLWTDLARALSTRPAGPGGSAMADGED